MAVAGLSIRVVGRATLGSEIATAVSAGSVLSGAGLAVSTMDLS